MPEPIVSVLLPVRDSLPFLDDCLRSLERQTLTSHEVILVDDGSTDGSAEALDRWAASRRARQRGCVHVLHLPPTGLVGALQAGLSICHAPLIARMDADDIAHPRRLELQTALMEAQPEVDVVACRARFFPRRLVATGFRLYEQWLDSLEDHEDIWRERFIESPVAHPSVMIRRSCLDDIGSWQDTDWPEDYDLWLRLLEQGARFAKVPRALLFWREHAERLTRRDARYEARRFIACKAHYLARGPLAGRTDVVIWGAGRTGRRLSAALIARGVTPRGFVDVDPSKIGRMVQGCRVVSPERLRALLSGAGGDQMVILAAVASRGARLQIRDHLTGLGLVETRGFWCVA